MSETTKTPALSRREVTGLVVAATALAATPALAGQPHMRAALSHCQAALIELKAAKHNKGGHRRTAIEHLDYVIAQIKEGIDHAN